MSRAEAEAASRARHPAGRTGPSRVCAHEWDRFVRIDGADSWCCAVCNLIALDAESALAESAASRARAAALARVLAAAFDDHVADALHLARTGVAT